jgi:tRNA(Ile)-lysidine synthase
MLRQEITTFIEKHSLLPQGSRIVVGLSGGPDSVFLLHVLHGLQKTLNLTLVAAHLDHQWRIDSEYDVFFCQSMAQTLGIPFISAKAGTLHTPVKNNGSQEEVGRKLRRQFLEQVREQFNADYIALGHHAQDQQETFFLRLIRGTTLSGLVSMRPKSGFYIRPLLAINKSEIITSLKQKNIPFLIDPTNDSDLYLRNRIRSKVLPALELCDARFNHNFERTLKSLHETEDFLTRLTEQAFLQVTHFDGALYHLDIAAFFALDPVIQNRVLMAWLIKEQVPYTPADTFLQEIKRFLSNKKHKEHAMHHLWSLQKDDGKATLLKNQPYTFETNELSLQ